MNNEELMRLLGNIRPAEAATSIEIDQILSMVQTPAFAALYAMLLSSRQAAMVQLSVVPLGNAEASARASVIQGKIQGIDILAETLLSLLPPQSPSE